MRNSRTRLPLLSCKPPAGIPRSPAGITISRGRPARRTATASPCSFSRQCQELNTKRQRLNTHAHEPHPRGSGRAAKPTQGLSAHFAGMGRSIILEVLDRPVTSAIIGLCVGVWLRIHSVGLGYEQLGCSFELAVRQKQLWRLLTAQLSHVSGLHLLFNCASLWNMGGVEQRGPGWAAGSLFYLSYTLLFLVLAALAIVGLYAIAVKVLRREQDAHTFMVGYSCVVFAWMSYLAAAAGATATYSLYGVVSIPANLIPFGALIFTSIIVPHASFLGHLAGLCAGYIMAFLPTVPPLACIGVFACFLAAVGWSLWRQHGALLRSYLPPQCGDDVELG